jgi:hypothetical protein
MTNPMGAGPSAPPDWAKDRRRSGQAFGVIMSRGGFGRRPR